MAAMDEDPLSPVLPGAAPDRTASARRPPAGAGSGTAGTRAAPAGLSRGVPGSISRGAPPKSIMKSPSRSPGLVTRVDGNGDEYYVLSEFAVRNSAEYQDRTGGASALQYRRNTREPSWYAAPPPWALLSSGDVAGPDPDDDAEKPPPQGPSRTSVDGLRSSLSLLKDMPKEPKWKKRPMQTIHSTGRATMSSLHSTLSRTGSIREWRPVGVGAWLPWNKSKSPDNSTGKLQRVTSHAMHSISTTWTALAGPPSDEARRRMPNPVADVSTMDPHYGSKRIGSIRFQQAPGANIIHPLSQFRKMWDIALILLFLVSTLYGPAYVAFYWEKMDDRFLHHEEALYIPVFWIGIVKDLFFLLDLVVVFNAGYVRKHDFIAIMDRRAIAMRYLRSWFFSDALTSVPVTVFILAARTLSAHRFLRIYEVAASALRLNRVLRATARVKNHYTVPVFQARIMQWLFVAVLFLHWNSCLQYLVAVATGFPEGCWVTVLGLQERPVIMQYIWSVYNAASQMLAIGYGPVDPTIDQEVIVVMVSFMLSTVLFPVLISIITTSLISMDSLRQQYQTQLQSWDQYMAHRRMPLELRERIRSAMDYRWRTRKAVNEEDMMDDLPIALQLEVRLDMCAPLIEQVPIFKDAPVGFINSLVVFLKLEIYMEGDFIIREATIGREMFFIHSGVVEVLQSSTTLEYLGKGEYFGEIAVLQEVARSASCRAVTHCEVSILGKEDLDLMLREYPSMAEVIHEAARERLVQSISRSSFGASQIQRADTADASDEELSVVAEEESLLGGHLPKSSYSMNKRQNTKVHSFASAPTRPMGSTSQDDLPV